MVVKTLLASDPLQVHAAFAYLEQGVKEIKGRDAHPVITASYRAAGFDIQDDVTAWCGGFQSLCFKEVGLPIPLVNPLGGINWESWGKGIYHDKRGEGSVSAARRGDVCTFYYEGKSSWKRHVCQYLGIEGGRVWVIGGNQLNAVSVASYSLDNLASIRRAVPATKRDLIDAGSTEMANIDKLDKSTVGTVVLTAVGTAAQGMQQAPTAPFPVADPATVEALSKTAEGVSAGQTIIEGAHSIGATFGAAPWLFLMLLVIGAMMLISWRLKKGRLARHAAGYPISTQVIPPPVGLQAG